ncbi:hypothetical protein D3C72_1626740 [compost metagenome]
MSRLPVVLLFVIHAHQAGVRHCHVRCDAYGAHPIRARTRVIVQGQAASAPIVERLFRRYIRRVRQCRIEIRQRLRGASRLAQKQAVIIAQLRIVGRKAQSVKEIFLGRCSLPLGREDQGAHAIGLRIVRRQLHGLLRFGQGHVELALRIVRAGQLQAQRGTFRRTRLHVPGDSLRRGRGTADQQHGQANSGHSERALVSHAFPHQERISTILPKLAPNFC